MDAFPAFVPLAGRTVVIVGEGEAADAKARLFEGSPARLVRIAGGAPDAAVFAGAALAFVAAEPAEEWAAAARAAGVPVNVVDRPALCGFVTPSIVDRGVVVGAIGTGGAAPVLAVRLRQELEALWPQRLGEVAALLARLREPARARLDSLDARRRFFRAVVEGEPARLALAGDLAASEAQALALLAGAAAPVGRLAVLVEPADLDRLTLGAVRRLGAADRLVVEGAVSPALLGFARRDAPRETPEAVDLVGWLTAGEQLVWLIASGRDETRLEAAAAGLAVERLA